VWGITSPGQFEPKASFIPAFIAALTGLLTGIYFTTPGDADTNKERDGSPETE
jgi:hypothetical protein